MSLHKMIIIQVWSTGEEYDGGWKNNLQQGQGKHRWSLVMIKMSMIEMDMIEMGDGHDDDHSQGPRKHLWSL